jgi:hypothetical protein
MSPFPRRELWGRHASWPQALVACLALLSSHISVSQAQDQCLLQQPSFGPELIPSTPPPSMHCMLYARRSRVFYFALFVTQSFRYSPSRALGVDGLFVNDTNFDECYGRGVCVVCFLNCSHCSHCVTCCQVHTLRILQLQQRVGRHRLQHTAQAVWSARLGCSQRPEPKVRLGFRRV